ncbi:hypothetical protein [Desulfococcus sp.]|uniref:hypothetical protein n=1 Tax=Desulfococcus sp. TaxID=2025834 RepID=UPI003593175C
MTNKSALEVTVDGAKVVVCVVGASVAATDAAVIILAVAGAAAITITGIGVYKWLSSD